MSFKNLRIENMINACTKNNVPTTVIRVILLLTVMITPLLIFPATAGAESASEVNIARRMGGGDPSPPPVLNNSGRRAWSQYMVSSSHSAFAAGANGQWGRSWGKSTAQEARQSVLAACGSSCEVISVDGVLLKTYPTANPNVPPLSLGTRGQEWWRYYTSRPNNKAFAMGLNGVLGVATNRSSVDAARQAAMDYCTGNNSQNNNACAIISVNGQMLNNFWLEAGLNPPVTLNEAGREKWQLYQMIEGNKAFYALPNGRRTRYSWGYNSLQAAHRGASSACGSGCELLSENGRTVKFHEPIYSELAPVPDKLSYTTWKAYVDAPGHKALAISTRKVNFSERQLSVDDARRLALQGCGSGCAIIALDNFFVDGGLYLQPPPGLDANGRVAWDIYLLAYGNKAFAIDGKGAYGSSWGWSTPTKARQRALRNCGSSCQVIAVNNEYQAWRPGSDQVLLSIENPKSETVDVFYIDQTGTEISRDYSIPPGKTSGLQYTFPYRPYRFKIDGAVVGEYIPSIPSSNEIETHMSLLGTQLTIQI